MQAFALPYYSLQKTKSCNKNLFGTQRFFIRVAVLHLSIIKPMCSVTSLVLLDLSYFLYKVGIFCLWIKSESEHQGGLHPPGLVHLMFRVVLSLSFDFLLK